MPGEQMAHMAPMRVAVIAESPLVRGSLQALVEGSPALGFAGSAADADALGDCLAHSAPDVVVTDAEPEAGDALKTAFDHAHAPPALVLLIDDMDSDWTLDALRGIAMAKRGTRIARAFRVLHERMLMSTGDWACLQRQ
ncbi:response regulator transcription factor [Paraburkholderia phymatum]|uniref:Response regulator receiver protein n=1 Tax=Paraburkholderia phymatum (strain DSM 17167 / CIP 108236 / LMG 21445 / STM815) TaxID=391038 RepID=B2JWA0_PARP8|nr:response regulator transcription factor [Paraburkholderia phymatum]ACC75227.1 hypothetical protein Bphy_6176 [Paraburkholderia phymatum STM815]